MRPAHPTLLRVPATVRRALVATLAALLLLPAGQASAGAVGADEPNPVTPGHFSGYGFDQCLAPTQAAMDAWLLRSPYLAVGIYISGDSRACRQQPNLTPTWIRTQLRKGWRLLPITLGPQASCQPRFPRYRDDFKISADPGPRGNYLKARKMGRENAAETVADARALGIVPGSTLWYDLEGYDSTNRHCRESALAFLSGWTATVRDLDYVAGVYSSAGSGIADLDRARIQRRRDLNLPDRIWLARWDGVGNTSSSYLREDGWRPGHRVKQFRGGHDETWGGVRINIDTNRLQLGRGPRAYPERHCGGVAVNFGRYHPLAPASGGYRPPAVEVKALQCLLKERNVYAGPLNGRYTRATMAAVRAWQQARGLTPNDRWSGRNWMSLHTLGGRPVLKFGVAGGFVRRLQRGVNAAALTKPLKVTGLFDQATQDAVKRYQRAVGVAPTGVVTPGLWTYLRSGRR